MKKKILLFIAALFLSPTIADATCYGYDFEFLSKLASNVKISYQYEIKEDNSIKYKITLANVNVDMKILDNKNVKVYQGFKNYSDFVIETKDGGNYIFEIYSKKCPATKLATKSINLPYYNPLAIDKRCAGLEEYPVCNRWANYSGDANTFEKDLKKAKDDYAEKHKTPRKKIVRERTLLDKIIAFVVRYLFIIIGILLILILIGNKLYKKYKEKTEFNFKL